MRAYDFVPVGIVSSAALVFAIAFSGCGSDSDGGGSGATGGAGSGGTAGAAATGGVGGAGASSGGASGAGTGGAGTGGTSGGGAGGASGGGTGGAAGSTGCTSTADCPEFHFCNWPDGKCGKGAPGVCETTPHACSHGVAACFCDGTISPVAEVCEGEGGKDFDSTGTACNLPATALACGYLVCDYGADDYCQYTPSPTGGEPNVFCVYAPANCSPAQCSCLGTKISDCNGTCTDGPNGPTITCTPG